MPDGGEPALSGLLDDVASMDRVETLCAELGQEDSSPNSLNDSRSRDASPKCNVCQDLKYRFSVDRLRAIGGYSATVRKTALHAIDFSQGAPETRMMPNGGLGIYFTKDWVPPHPSASDWIQSAIRGCASCQLVIGAISAILPSWFSEYDATNEPYLNLRHKHIYALAVDDIPLMIGLTDVRERWYHLRHDFFQVFTVHDQSRCWPTIGSAEPVCPSNREHTATEKIKKWIKRCRNEHQCGTRNTRFMPTRLISIGQPGKPVKLVDGTKIEFENDAAYLPYVALSYCWGPFPQANLRSLKENIENHQTEIPIHQAPAAVKDVIELTRNLGYKYIWIDALCIIQDDEGDWAKESTKLGSIYSMADLVISNDTSGDCRKPLFVSQDFGSSSCHTTFVPYHRRTNDFLSMPYVPEFLEHNSSESRGVKPIEQTSPQTQHFVHIRRSPYEAHDALPKDRLSPLNSRAWTFQEGIMARRRLILTRMEMFWACLGEQHCECLDGSSLIKGSVGFKAQQLMIDTMRSVVFPTSSFEPEEERLHWLWKHMVMIYSVRSLTDWRDRLVAIQGLVNVMEDAHGRIPATLMKDCYHAGLWKGDFVEGLLWTARKASELIDDSAYTFSALAPENTLGTSKSVNPFKEKMIHLNERKSKQAFRKARATLPLMSGKPFQTLTIDRRFRRLNSSTNHKAFPSWSWVSTPYPVAWHMNPVDITVKYPFRPDIQILDIQCKLESWDAKQRITSGCIVVKGLVAPVRLRSMVTGWKESKLPDFASMKYPSRHAQGIMEFFEAVERSQSYVLFNGDLVAPFTSDSACLYGDVRKAYEGWGQYMFTEFLEYRETDSLFILVTRLITICIIRWLRSFSSFVYSKFLRTSKEKKRPAVLDMAPCWESFEPIMQTRRLCHDCRCNCHRGWTESHHDPAFALCMGSYKFEEPRGRSLLKLAFLVLRPSPFDKGAFVRIGIGFVERYGDEAGYDNLFKEAPRRIIKIE